MSFIYSTILLSLTVMAIIGLGKLLSKKKRLFYSIVVLLGITILGYFNSFQAIAATDLAALGANESTLTPEQQQIEELKVTPGGGHYSGIEYAEPTTRVEKAVSDDSIEKSIKADTGDNVVVAVANGSVRFSGRVKDKETAQEIVEQTKAIPGVFEITFNLGLDNKAS
ncbi:BON domain-containing protein [Pleurocapsales cyanobacterium LEGE 10410]|nr:BON domain-containing protein [Pleurocapsales cyanobacterium LEGE 10410]